MWECLAPGVHQIHSGEILIHVIYPADQTADSVLARLATYSALKHRFSIVK